MRLICICVCLSMIGCAIVPQVSWSPDGKTAVYQQTVIDPKGSTVDTIGPPTFADGVGVWSADSTSYYYARQEVSGTVAPTTALRRWVGDADADKSLVQRRDIPNGWPRTTVYCWRAGKAEPVVTLWSMWVMAIAVSPDQRWLMIDGIDISSGSLIFNAHLQAYQMQSKKLYALSDGAYDCCFTANNRVAYVEADGSPASHIVETTLDESAATLTSTPLLTVMSSSTSALAVTDSGLLVETSQANFPAPANQPVINKIFAVQHDGKQFRELATAVSGTMSRSPDGKRILFIRPSDDAADQIVIMNSDGTGQRMLMDLAPFSGGLPMHPTWHGSDRITFVAVNGTVVHPQKDHPQKLGENQDRVAYDIVDYTIPPTGPMQPAATLSQNWAAEAKPSNPLLTTVEDKSRTK